MLYYWYYSMTTKKKNILMDGYYYTIGTTVERQNNTWNKVLYIASTIEHISLDYHTNRSK